MQYATAAVEALNGDVTAQVLVDMLVERGLLQHSEEGECFVTGELVVYTNGILNLLGYSPDAFVDAALITNSWMHLVMSCPVLVRLGVEIELELDVGSTPSTRRRRRGDAAATLSFHAAEDDLDCYLLVVHVRAHRPGGDE